MSTFKDGRMVAGWKVGCADERQQDEQPGPLVDGVGGQFLDPPLSPGWGLVCQQCSLSTCGARTDCGVLTYHCGTDGPRPKEPVEPP